jgi:membrane associated rhomboid family serine protease
LPLSDRDYMKPSPPPPRRRVWTVGGSGDFWQNPVYVIIIINFIVFIAALINSDKIVGNLGLVSNLFTERPWTILTNMFVHAEFWHIFGNMITLFFFGRVVYQLVGSGRFLLLYFVGGIVGNSLFIWLDKSGLPAIGASAAIYALAGALVVMMPTMRVAIWGILPMPLWVVVLLFFVLWSVPNFIPGIAWQAHLGGLVVGLAAGFYFRKKYRFIYYR